jgi:hypothetical protein
VLDGTPLGGVELGEEVVGSRHGRGATCMANIP